MSMCENAVRRDYNNYYSVCIYVCSREKQSNTVLLLFSLIPRPSCSPANITHKLIVLSNKKLEGLVDFMM